MPNPRIATNYQLEQKRNNGQGLNAIPVGRSRPGRRVHPSKHTTIFKAKVLKRDDHRDLSILDHSTIPTTEYFEFDGATQEVAVGDAVVAFGYPDWVPGDRLNQRPGHVSLLTPKAGMRKIEVTQALTQGMSGGPIIDVRGQVIGVIYKAAPTKAANWLPIFASSKLG